MGLANQQEYSKKSERQTPSSCLSAIEAPAAFEAAATQILPGPTVNPRLDSIFNAFVNRLAPFDQSGPVWQTIEITVQPVDNLGRQE
jgi:hypothetical protein